LCHYLYVVSQTGVFGGQATSSLLSSAAVDETEFRRSQPSCFGFSLQGNTTAQPPLSACGWKERNGPKFFSVSWTEFSIIWASR
jgi:hypothetical protein